MIETQELLKPKGVIPDKVLDYIAQMCGSTIELYLDGRTVIKSVKLGHHTFSATTNRELIEKVFRKVSELRE